jgi:hypothetical protein
MSKDPTDPGVDLRITQPFGEWMVGTTWHWIHPHGYLSLMERFNLEAKKGLHPSALVAIIVE